MGTGTGDGSKLYKNLGFVWRARESILSVGRHEASGRTFLSTIKLFVSAILMLKYACHAGPTLLYTGV